MSLLGGFLGRAKDGAVSAAGRQLLAAALTKYGAMLNFSVDSTNKTVSAEILLKGEREPVKITLRDYELLPGEISGGAPRLRVGGATASREWVEVLLNELLVGRAVELPPKAAPLLKLVI